MDLGSCEEAIFCKAMSPKRVGICGEDGESDAEKGREGWRENSRESWGFSRSQPWLHSRPWVL